LITSIEEEKGGLKREELEMDIFMDIPKEL